MAGASDTSANGDRGVIAKRMIPWQRAATLAALGWLILQPVVFHWRVLISKTAYLPFDLPGFHTPLASVVVEALRQHRLPLWDPYVYGGYPIHADTEAQILYPLAWPAFLRAALWREHTLFYWLEWQTVVHIVLAGLFTWWFLRRSGCGRWTAIFGATVYQLGCFFSAQAQHLGAVCGGAWMPLAWMAVFELSSGFRKRWFAALAAALALSFLAGFAAIALIVYGSTLMVALGLWWSRRGTRRLPLWTLLAMAASLVLAAAQIVPTAMWSPHSVASLRWMWNQGGGLPPKALLSVIWPDWFHVFTPERYQEPYSPTFMYLYNGAAALGLLMAAPWLRTRLPARLFALLTGAFVVIMLGHNVPGYTFLFGLLPRQVRGAAYVEFTTAAFTLAMALAAALALEHLTRGKRAWLAALVAFGTGVELIGVASNRMMNATAGDWRMVDSSRIYFEREEILQQLHRWLYATVPPKRTDTIQHEYRFATVSSGVRLPSLGGDNPFAPLRMIEYRKLFCNGAPWERFYAVDKPASPLLDAGNVGFLLQVGDDLDEAPLRAAGWERIPWNVPLPLHVFRNRESLPRYYLVAQVRRAGSAEEARDLLQSIDPRREAVAESFSAPERAPNLAEPELPAVEVISYRPDRVELRTRAERPAYLVLAESWAPGWHARVDGVPAPIHPTNLAFQGLPLSAGIHNVRVEYVPIPAFLALGVSLLAWIALVLTIC